MYRKPRGSESASILNLDSLMDILSCLVGVMLFLVIYTVLELGSTSFEVSVPTPRDRPVESRRVLILANGGTVRPMDSNRPISELLTGVQGVALEQVSEFVRQANLSPPTDAHFQYRLGFDEEASVLDPQARAFDIEIRQLPGEPGDSIHQLEAGSSYSALLGSLDPDFVWLEFAVDSVSLRVFRRARDLAEQQGFATRWGPLELAFPVRFDLGTGGGGPAPRSTFSKPQR